MADSAASTCGRSVTSAVKAKSASDGRRSTVATFKTVGAQPLRDGQTDARSATGDYRGLHV